MAPWMYGLRYHPQSRDGRGDPTHYVGPTGNALRLPSSAPGLAAVDGAAQGLDFFAEIVGQFYAFAGDVADAVAGFANAVFGFVGPIAESVLGVFKTALQVAAHLFASLGCEQEAGQSSCAEADQEESDCRSHLAAF
jgi:hypothetical protein